MTENNKKQLEREKRLEKDIENAGIDDPVPYNVDDDINYIQESLQNSMKKTSQDKKTMTEQQKKKYDKEYIDFIKLLKFDIDNYQA